MARLSASAIVALLVFAPLFGCTGGERVGDGILKPVDAHGSVDVSRPDVEDTRGELGDACLVSADCRSGVCAASATGGVCSTTCADGCSDGYTCLASPTQGEICWKDDAIACQPCLDASDCVFGGLSGACVSYGAAGSFCGLACGSAADCPAGFSCDGSGQCVADSGTCSCNKVGYLLERATSCAVENEHGSCEGARRCASGGLTRCEGQIPRPETCNGKDDNCNGETDEGTDGQPCELTNEFGTCVGEIQCRGGLPLCVGRAPAAEVCNGVDDNCDGQIDEGFPDLDGDGVADCVDPDIDGDGWPNEEDCAPRDPAIHPGATEVCDGVDNNCSGVVDDGVDGALDRECEAYVCAGAAGCRTRCEADAHCIPGHLCDLFDDSGSGRDDECLPSVCGNGVVEIREACDDGINDGSYGGCLADCSGPGPSCGDGVRQPEHELCDDGPDNGQPNKCNLTCSGITPPDCGNGVVEAGEECDLGAANSNDPDAGCRTDCTLPRCGDGVVDVAAGEECDAGAANGASLCGCQSDCRFAPDTVVCRAAADVCDVEERCTGAGTCPANAFASAEVECRPSEGACDPAEHCTGEGAACPPDVRSGEETVCRAAEGLCDVEERCDGVSAECPADVVLGLGELCREAAGPCDVEERCDGVSPLCPVDTYLPETIICRDAAGACDVEERCTGDGPACPDDALLPAETVCRPAAGDCDMAEVCDGETAACPPDELIAAGEVCRAASGACEADAECTGTSATCPPNVLATAGTICNPSTGTCDPAEVCDGESGACPEDVFIPDGEPCFAGQGGCVFEPCVCEAGDCTPLCGNGVVDVVHLDDNVTLAEACDAGALGGARDECNWFCTGICDADFSWVVPAGGSFEDTGRALAIDEAGVSYAAGTFYAGQMPSAPSLYGDVPFGAAAFGGDFFFGVGDRDVWLMVQDTESDWRWSSCSGGWYDDVAAGVGVDRHGAVYLGGHFQQMITINCCDGGFAEAPGFGGCETLESGGGHSDWEYDIFLAKWDDAGTLEWAVSGGAPFGGDEVGDVATDPLGYTVVVGKHGGTVGSPAVFGGHAVSSAGSDNAWFGDILVAKFGPAGQTLWATGAGVDHVEDMAHGVALDGAGDIYVTGFFGRSFTWGDVFFEHPDDNGTGGGDAFLAPSSPMFRNLFVAKLSADGAPLWGAVASAPYGHVEGTAIAVDNLGRAYVVGHFGGGEVRAGDLSAVTHHDAGLGHQDIVVARLTAGGQWDWLAVAADDNGSGMWPGDDRPWGVDVDRAGSVYVTGQYTDSIRFGDHRLEVPPWECPYEGEDEWMCEPVFFGAGLPQRGINPGEGGGGRDGFIAKLDRDGVWRWAKSFGGGAGDAAGRAVAVDPRGNIYLTGAHTETARFDDVVIGPDGSTPEPQGQGWGYTHAFVAKLVPDGPADGCFECGDGVLDPGEGCDDGGLDHCAGECDALCFGPANFCGDGWVECAEVEDLGGGADLGEDVCALQVGNLWCFEAEAGVVGGAYTNEPVFPGRPAGLGGGLIQSEPVEDLLGNVQQHPDCPSCDPGVQADVTCRAGSAQQWGGDGPPIVQGSSARSLCDGDPATPPCHSLTPGCVGTNDEPAAIECEDFFEFVATTGEEVAFEFDERSSLDGPTRWSLWASFSGVEGTFHKLYEGTTTKFSTNFDLPTPMHRVPLTQAYLGGFPLRSSHNVHFRLYGWGSSAPGGSWSVDNVRVGSPSAAELGPATVVWCFETATGEDDPDPTVDESTLAPSVVDFSHTSPTGFVAAANNILRPEVCGTASSRARNTNGWDVAQPDPSRYIEVRIHHAPGRYWLAFEAARSATGPPNVRVVSTLVGELGTMSPLVYSSWGGFTWQGFLPGGEHRIRLHGYGASGSGGTMRIDNVQLIPLD